MGGDVPKQFQMLDGAPVLAHSLKAFATHPRFGPLVVVCAPEWSQFVMELAGNQGVDVMVATGGASRRESVANGIGALSTDVAHVFVHDAARPGLSLAMLDQLIAALRESDAALPALPVVDSLSQARDGTLESSVDRNRIVRVQTPQAFRAQALRAAHAQWPDDAEATDDARMAQAAGFRVATVAGEERLMKLTQPGDFEIYSRLFGKEQPKMMRIGQGYDVHRLERGEELWLCGVQIDHEFGLSGHSDADVALHALTDAILGAIGAGDIGQHFPPSDPQWRGARSAQFLAHAMQLARDKGYALANADITLICERPKIGPHREAMRECVAAILGVAVDRISIKATTTEKLGFTGREEGIAAQAIVLLNAR